MIKIYKILTFYVPKNIFNNVMIESVKKLNVLNKRLIYPQRALAQIYNYIIMANINYMEV